MTKGTKGLIGAVTALAVATGGLVAAYVFLAPRVEMTGETTLEAGGEFDPWGCGLSIVNGSKDDFTIKQNVDMTCPGEYQVTFTAWCIPKTFTVTVADTTGPEIRLADGTLTVGMSKGFDLEELAESVQDNTGDFQLEYKVISGDISKEGTAKVEISATDNYGNVSSKELTVKVVDDVPPVLVVSSNELKLRLGEKVDVESLVEFASDNAGEVTVFTEVTQGDIEHAGASQVEIVAEDENGNQARETIVVNIIDDEAPVLVLQNTSSITGTKVKANKLVAKSYDNDGTQTLSFSGMPSSNSPVGDYIVTVTSKDASGNSVSAQAIYTIKDRVYNAYGWDITGVDGQPYLVAVNRACNTVTVYGKDGDGNYSNAIKAMTCSTARAGYTTPTGVFKTTNRYRWRLLVDGTYGQYSIRVVGGILFHSVPYYSMNVSDLEYPEYNNLGQPASQGCIRLCVSDVMWLYYNCPTGFTTIIYDDGGNAGPLGQPGHYWIDVNNEYLRGWDPTDPAAGNPYH